VRAELSSTDRSRLIAAITRAGQIATAAAVPCAIETLRRALRGDRINATTIRALRAHLDTQEGTIVLDRAA
jgi:hypothetical protein